MKKPNNFGIVKGSTFWHRLKPNQGPTSWEECLCKPGEKPRGRGWKPGHHPKSDEARKKMSETNTGRVMSKEWRANMSKASKGKPKSEAHKAAMSAAMKERHRRNKEGE